MNTVSVFAISTLLAASVSSVALAQDVNVDTGVGAEAGAVSGADTRAQTGIGAETGVGADTGIGAQTGVGAETGIDNIGGGAAADAAGEGLEAGEGFEAGVATDFDRTPTYGEVISSLRASGDGEGQIDVLGESESARVIVLSDLRADPVADHDALDEAVADQEDRMGDLRGAIEENTALTDALDADGYTADDVVAVSSGANGEVHLIVDG